MIDYEIIRIIPILHRNVINFMGMQNRNRYLATRKEKDRFITLNTQGYLTSWSILTGKIISHKKIDIDV